jgi:hypothetical protein
MVSSEAKIDEAKVNKSMAEGETLKDVQVKNLLPHPA